MLCCCILCMRVSVKVAKIVVLSCIIHYCNLFCFGALFMVGSTRGRLFL